MNKRSIKENEGEWLSPKGYTMYWRSYHEFQTFLEENYRKADIDEFSLHFAYR